MKAKLVSHEEQVRHKWLGKRINVNTTNFPDEEGIIPALDLSNNDPESIFGIKITIVLNSGKTIYARKFEGLTLIHKPKRL